MIRITANISLNEDEINETFVRASGPGGQNVNKLASAVQLRFDVNRSPALSEEIRHRLKKLAGRKMTKDGILLILAQRYRTQEQNREDALERLIELIRQAAIVPLKRKATRPTLASKKRRLEKKNKRSHTKQLRHKKIDSY